MKFRALESWRGLCALGVVLYHCNIASHLRYFAPVRNADLGVDFFFVLSGFVLAYAYSQRLAQASAGYNFMIRRTGRLLPLHLFALGVLLLLELLKWVSVYRFDAVAGDIPFTGPNSMTALFVSVFLLNGLGFLPYFAWNGPSWSISTEFWTYLLFLVACLAGPRTYRLIFTLVFLACGLVLALLDARHVQLHTYEGAGMLRCLYGFSSGALVYLLYRRIKASDTAPPPWLEFLALTAMAGLFSGLCSWSRSLAPLVFSCAILIFAFEGGCVRDC
jgi:peptidoglycan/LPS O-acetylase OafA/YrhL